MGKYLSKACFDYKFQNVTMNERRTGKYLNKACLDEK